MSEPQRVMIASPNWLGDAVMALPAMADVRRRFPSARLVVAARRSVADLFSLVPGIDAVVALDWRGHVWRRREYEADVARVRAVSADVAVLLPNSFASAWLVRQAGVPERWGFAADHRRRLLSRAVTTPRRSIHQVEYYQHLVRELGIENGGSEPMLCVPEPVLDLARGRLVEAGWDPARPLVVMAPGAAYGTAKRWIPAHVVDLVGALTRKGAHVVLVGSGGDRQTTSWIRARVPDEVRAHVTDLAGQTTIESLAGTMSHARVCVTNDSGALHVAAALGVNVAAIFGPTREYETAPPSTPRRRVGVVTHPVWCRPCMLRECPIDHRCMTGIAPARVFAIVSEMLERGTGAPATGGQS